MAHYLDTSAAVKLVVAEPGSKALTAWVAENEESLVSSDLLRTELLRATRRGAPEQMARARAVIASLTLVRLGPQTYERAALLDPTTLRTLDALHLAAALELDDEVEGIVTYDARLADAAAALGMEVIAPT